MWGPRSREGTSEMVDVTRNPGRRGALGVMLAAGGMTMAASTGRAQSAAERRPFRLPAGGEEAEGDWDWLVGAWTVSHRKLRERLVGSQEWLTFEGTCVSWPLLGGQGNVDDNLLYDPTGVYRGASLRALDPTEKLWSIWWLDSRAPERIDVPVRGGFERGVGVFLAEDSWKGTPVTVRFRWSAITPVSAVWDQAFSTDKGATWETNWVMDFKRARGEARPG